MDNEGSLDGFIYDHLKFEDFHDGGLRITDLDDKHVVILRRHHLQMLSIIWQAKP